jgi:histidyl-tRNA synthetase
MGLGIRTNNFVLAHLPMAKEKQDLAYRVEGVRDLGFSEMAKFRQMEGVFGRVCRQFGYQEVRTPVLEHLDLYTMARALTPSTLSSVYSFLDWDGWSGSRVVLRPDATVGLCRMYLEGLAERGLARLYYVQNMFRFDRRREEGAEFWQFGAEVFGHAVSGLEGDSEILLLATDAIAQITGKEPIVRLSHANVIRRLLATAGLNDAQQQHAFDLLQEGRTEELMRLRESCPQLEKLTRLLSTTGESSAFVANMSALWAGTPGIEQEFEHLGALARMLEKLGVAFQVDFSLARDLEYYTGLMFDLVVAEHHVGGGGRYDSLVEALGGEQFPGCGFGLYFRELSAVAEEAEDTEARHCEVLVRPETPDEASVTEAHTLARQLRKRGLGVEVFALAAGERPRQPPRYQVVVSRTEDGATLRVLDGRDGSERQLSAGDVEALAEIIR